MDDADLRSRRRQRQDGLARLRRYTTRAVVAAAGLVGALSVLAATSVPGHSTSTGGGAQQSQSPQQQPANAQQQDPFQQDRNQSQAPTFVGSGGGGSPWAVSGGS